MAKCDYCKEEFKYGFTIGDYYVCESCKNKMSAFDIIDFFDISPDELFDYLEIGDCENFDELEQEQAEDFKLHAHIEEKMGY